MYYIDQIVHRIEVWTVAVDVDWVVQGDLKKEIRCWADFQSRSYPISRTCPMDRHPLIHRRTMNLSRQEIHIVIFRRHSA